MMTNAVSIVALEKSYGPTKALSGLDLEVRSSEVHGFLGPNGAGKTTTLRILLGLLRADAGRAEVLAMDPWRDAVALHRRLAYVPGDVELWPSLTGGETIDLLGRLRGGLDLGRRSQLIERFEFDPTKKNRSYSKGNRQKVALIAALAAEVELLIFDEPTSGLDPLMEAEFQECVRDARTQGRTVLLSSHILAQVEALADRVSIIRSGQVVETGTLGDLRHLRRTVVNAKTTGPADTLAAVEGVHALTTEGDAVRFEVDEEHLGGVLSTLASLGVRSLECRQPTLEQLLLRHYHSAPRPDAGPSVGEPA